MTCHGHAAPCNGLTPYPSGMGIKGGIARKLLKECYGTPEPPGSFDIDVLLFIDKYTQEVGKGVAGD